MGSKLGLILALVGGALYLWAGVTTSVNASTLDSITSLITNNVPQFSSYLIPTVKWVTTFGGAGVILGGLIAYFSSSQFHEYGGYIILLSSLGGILAYGAIIFEAQQSGVFSQSLQFISSFFINMGPGLVASVLSILAYLKK